MAESSKIDLESINRFYEFLQGEKPEGMKLLSQPKMTPKQAFSIIYFLQENLYIFPDTIEKCSVCNKLYDTDSEGIYWESKGKFYCGSCVYLVPENYDRGKK